MSKTNIFKVLSDKRRRDILVMLKDGRKSAGEIAEQLGISPSDLSYHLRLLKTLILSWNTRTKILYTMKLIQPYLMN